MTLQKVNLYTCPSCASLLTATRRTNQRAVYDVHPETGQFIATPENAIQVETIVGCQHCNWYIRVPTTERGLTRPPTRADLY
jgi:RNase P subunit RPR2